MREIIKCKCGKSAKRSLCVSISYSSKDGHSEGSNTKRVDCCHKRSCLVAAMSSCFPKLQREEADRVKRYGRKTDATLVEPVYR